MGIRLQDITTITAGLLNSANKFLVNTSGNLTRTVAWSTFADWATQTYTAFTQSGTGAVAGSVQSSLRRVWYPEQFGAVGDGVTDDAAAWALLITAVGSSNFEIRGKPGATYLIGAGGINFASKTNGKIVGNGAKIKLNAVATATLATLGKTSIIFDTCTFVEFSGWDIDGNSQASNIIGLEDCVDCTVSKNRTANGGLSANIFSTGGTRNSFIDNTVYDGIGVSRGLWIGNTNTIEHENDPIIRGNRVRDMPATAIGGTCTGAIIEGNHCLDCDGAGIALGAVASPDNYKRTVIKGNVCRGNLFHGIQSDASSDSNYTEHVDVVGNLCETSVGSGIYIVRARDWVVSGNICRDNNSDGSGTGDGIQVDRAKRIILTGNLCEDTRSGGSRTQTSGISIQAQVAIGDTEDILVIGNLCRNNTVSGINATNASPATIVGLSIVGNYCNDNATNGVHITDAAAGEITEVTVVGNHAIGNGTSDLRVDPPDAVISGNRYVLSPAGTLILTFAASDTTPSVKGRNLFKTNNGSGTTITTFDDGVPGQEITIIFTDANTTISEASNIKLSAAFTSTADDTMTLTFDGTSWFEKCRSVN